MLQQAINNEFFKRKIARQCVTLVTQIRVERDDPAFLKPTKPIGSFMDEATARRFEAEGWQVMEDAGRGWRRVIASPQPVEIVEEAAIAEAVAAGWIVIAMGGGGIPVTRNSKGELRGIPAVVDKDLGSSLLASRIGADLFLISTGVEQVALDYGKPTQRNVAEMTANEARRYVDEGHFPAGSMKPKIEACIRFIEQSQNLQAYALITNPQNLGRALQGATGTRIVRG
jgi:carbamate kinase